MVLVQRRRVLRTQEADGAAAAPTGTATQTADSTSD
jgi:hypothetical protein